ncbi:NmrA family NAD(P)-binding protein [bacterium]|nr:NmrA family NAD(P)-binding protein [bacterium]
MYAVCGATGNTGRIVAEFLLKQGKQVRAIGRDAVKLQSLVDQGAEACVGSLEDLDFVKQTFAGAKAAYLMIPPNMAADDFRGYQRKVVGVLSKAIKAARIKHAVSLSSIGANHPVGTGVIVGLHDLEMALNNLDSLNVLHLRAAFFMENFFMNIGLIKNMGINGMPASGEIPMPVIASQDIGAYAAKRLAALDFSGSSYQYLLGERDISMKEVTSVLGKAIGKPDLSYVQFPLEQAKQGMIGAGVKPNLAELYIEMYRGAAEGKLMPEKPRDAESTTPTSLEEFSKTFAAVYNR